MYKMYPLELSNVPECMIKVNVADDSVIGEFYNLTDDKADLTDINSRYSKIPFYKKELKNSEYPNTNYVDWVNVFCKICEEEYKN